MKLKKPETENERLLSSVLLVFIIYFGLNSLVPLLGEKTQYFMTISFLLGMGAGMLFFIYTKPKEKKEEKPIDRNLAILERALTEDEVLLLRMIKNSEGITQDSLRFRTGFSKSKASALLLNLEKNGIIYREKLGKTYKLFVSDWLRKS